MDASAYVQVEKLLLDPSLDAEAVADFPPPRVFRPLPAEVSDRLGARAVDYASFAVAYLPPKAAGELVKIASGLGLVVQTQLDRRVELPWHTFEPGNSEQRTPPGFRVEAHPVPEHYLIQFGYPTKEDWLTGLVLCGVEPLAFVQQRTFLVRAESLDRVRECAAAAPYVAWMGEFLDLDRVSPELMELESSEGWELHFAPGTDLATKLRNLPAAMVGERLSAPAMASIDGTESLEGASLLVRGPVTELRALVASDSDLLSITSHGVGELSDERQGQIVAGTHNGVQPLLTPRYVNWLGDRGLLGASNQQTVCVVDSGYDTGFGTILPGSQRHPDFASPAERVAAFGTFPQNNTTWDRVGHGTMVAGIIAAEGGGAPPVPGSYSVADPAGFLMGSGIAPRSKLAFARIEPAQIDSLSLQAQALSFCRVTSGSFIANESWDERLPPDASSPYYRPQNQYSAAAQFFDRRVLDANDSAGDGLHTMSIVFAAGNDAWDPGTGSIRRNSVASPALAKNVIAVGATTSYRPYPEPPSGCRGDATGLRPPDQDSVNIARVANFSGRGKVFSATGAEKLHQVRVKPDLVAPAVRVFSTVPFSSISYVPDGISAAGCVKSYPAPLKPAAISYTPYTYGSGTSFAAPVVSGVAALARKWFLDRGNTPSPSLIKAALIATAEDLGPSGLAGNDARPSPNYGWGRVSLNRLTDSAARFYVTDNQALAVTTAQQRSWQRTVDNPASPTLIVLVWSDPPSSVPGSSQAALINNLGLSADEVGGNRFWRGKNFQEDLASTDTGFSYRFSAGQSPLTDAINNVEAIFIPANTFSAGQQLLLKVTGESVSQGSQKFAVYAYNVRLNQ